MTTLPLEERRRNLRRYPQYEAYDAAGTGFYGSGVTDGSYTSSESYTVSGSSGQVWIPATYGTAIWQRQDVSTFIESDLGDSVYFLTAPITLAIEHQDEEYVVTFPEAELSRSGETAPEALAWLKTSIIDLYELYSSESNLGPHPTKQLAVFEKYIGKKQDRARRRA